MCSPDKNPDVKGIHERFARLGVISTILRNKEGRKRCVSCRFSLFLASSKLMGSVVDMTSSIRTVCRNGGEPAITTHVSDLVLVYAFTVYLQYLK